MRRFSLGAHRAAAQRASLRTLDRSIVDIYFVGFRARPGQGLGDKNDVGGAYVNCWIKAGSSHEAQNVAYSYVTSEGWIVEAVEHEARLQSDPDKESEEHFEQAQIDGSCYVFHEWPVGDHSEEHVH